MRIGLVADTHEATEPLGLVSELRRHACEMNIHLGDIGGSPFVVAWAREFKANPHYPAGAPPAERQRFEELVRQGMPLIGAYIEAKLQDEPELRRRRRQETQESYDALIGAMSSLASPVFLAGNVDRSLLRAEIVTHCFVKHGVAPVTEPQLLGLGDVALLLWPSMKVADPGAASQLVESIQHWAEQLQDKHRVVVLAHEQLFKGPSPLRYRGNVEAAGHTPKTIPYFEPNPGRAFLLRLLRAVPAVAPTHYVHGHVHDDHTVIQAGAPYLRGAEGEGLEYRLYGLAAWRGRPDGRHRERRTIRIYPIPVNTVGVLTLANDSFNLALYPGSEHPGTSGQ